MSYTRILVALGLAAGVSTAFPSSADAQSRGQRRGPVVVGRAVPRTAPAPRIINPRIVTVVPYRRYYNPSFQLGLGFGYGYRAFGGYGYPAYGYHGYPYSGYSYGYGPRFPNAYGRRYGYVPGGYGSYGGVRIDLPQHDAQVFVDGYYAGIVNDFDGALQHLDLTPGPHRIEIRADGYQPIAFEVNIEPGRTITYRAEMQPLP